ncbi:MAG: Tn3 family transposase [Deinococcota bacterium]
MNKGSLARALEAFGRVPATLHLLTYHDDPQYRRTIGTQRNMQEARHSLARAVFGGRRGGSCVSPTERDRKISWGRSGWC